MSIESFRGPRRSLDIDVPGLQAENNEAWNGLYSQIRGYIIVIAGRNGVAAPDIEDILQEVIISVLQQIRRRNPNLFENLKSYISRVTVNEARDYYSKNVTRVKYEDLFAEAESLSYSQYTSLEDQPFLRAVLHMATIDNNGFAEAVLLQSFGMTTEEVAMALKLNHTTARTRMHRGKKLLRDIYETGPWRDQ